MPGGGGEAALAGWLRLPGLRWLRGHAIEHAAEDPVPGLPASGSLTAGTIFHATKLPLTSWFLAMWLITTAKNGISSVKLGRRLGIKQTNAWAMKQKIMAVMAGREDKRRLDGRVEMDDVYLGGHRPGKRGRAAAGQQLSVAAVSTSDDRRPRDQAPAGQGLLQEGVMKLVAQDRPRPAGSTMGCAAGPPRPRPGWSTP